MRHFLTALLLLLLPGESSAQDLSGSSVEIDGYARTIGPGNTVEWRWDATKTVAATINAGESSSTIVLDMHAGCRTEYHAKLMANYADGILKLRESYEIQGQQAHCDGGPISRIFWYENVIEYVLFDGSCRYFMEHRQSQQGQPDRLRTSEGFCTAFGPIARAP